MEKVADEVSGSPWRHSDKECANRECCCYRNPHCETKSPNVKLHNTRLTGTILEQVQQSAEPSTDSKSISCRYFVFSIPFFIRSDICFIMPDISPIILDIFPISSGVILSLLIIRPMSPTICDMSSII